MSLVTSLFNMLRYGSRWARNMFGIYDSEDTMIADAQKFWNDPETTEDGQYSHFRGSGIFKDDTKWLAVGKQSVDIFQEFTRAIEYTGPMDRMVEWGCGGGANAMHFAPLVGTFYGLDISKDCLVECAKQLNAEGFPNHKMVAIDAAEPEKALEEITEPMDVFACLYVIELFPSKEYTERILNIASQMLKPGGLAYLQFKYTTKDWQSETKRWNYANDPSNMISFWTDEFWMLCEKYGLMPQVIKLIPFQPLVTDNRYAYVICIKK